MICGGYEVVDHDLKLFDPVQFKAYAIVCLVGEHMSAAYIFIDGHQLTCLLLLHNEVAQVYVVLIEVNQAGCVDYWSTG